MARSDFKLVGEHYLLGLEQSSIAYFDNTIASTVDNLAKSLVNPVYYDDFNFIQKQLAVVEDQVIVDSVTLLDTGASILHEGSKDFPRLGTEVNIPPEDMESLRQGNLVMNIRDGQRTAMQGIFLGDELLGILSITSQPYAMSGFIQDIYHEVQEETQRIITVYALGAAAIILVLMFFAAIAAWITAERLVRPISLLKKQADHMGSGNLQVDNRIEREDELGELAKSIYTMAADLELQNRSVKYLAFHDPLTGIANRSSFQMDLEDQIVRTAEQGDFCALLFIDVDDFKSINDAAGHDHGDRALKLIADRISEAVNEFFEPGDLQPSIARIGGDEFTVLVPGNRNEAQLRHIVERVLEILSRPLMVEGDLHQVSGSIGISIYPKDADTASSLLNAADRAMYHSKFAGKGTYRFYDASMTSEDQSSHRIKTEFKAALSNPNELELLYQPIVNIKTGEIYGGEALMRWHHPKLGTIEPGQFISVVEHNEIALAADLWVIESTLDFLETMNLSQHPNFVVSANISASNLVREQFPEAVSRLLKQSPVNPKHLQLEITETYLHRDEEKAMESLNAIQAQGVKLWLDDFCTGYSSLKHLHMFPTNGIKIDRQFVINLNKHKEDRLLVSSMVSLADSFNIGIVAEGIDNQADRELLLSLGCPLGQGELFSRPVSAEKFLKLVTTKTLLPNTHPNTQD
ncbi:MAG: putative bifunctional diguanylate cyclase/phosphodiesterase [Porticoccaceae bacterium]